MAKHNPWSLARPEWQTATAAFTDPRHPGVEFSLTVRALDGAELMLVFERAEELVAQWVTGKGPQAPPLPYPLGGGTVKLSEGLVRAAVLIEAQQRQPDGEPYDPENFYDHNDLIGIAVNAPVAWSKLGPWAQGQLAIIEEGDGPGNE